MRREVLVDFANRRVDDLHLLAVHCREICESSLRIGNSQGPSSGSRHLLTSTDGICLHRGSAILEFVSKRPASADGMSVAVEFLHTREHEPRLSLFHRTSVELVL